MPSLKSYFVTKGSGQTESLSRSKPLLIQVLSETDQVVETGVAEVDNNITSCSLDCCNLYSPTAARLAFDKERSACTHDKRKRYFQPDWLNKFPWLVLCNTNNKAYCQTCCYVHCAAC